VHGRFLVRPAFSPPPVGMLFGFHGYAQTAEMLHAELEAIPGTGAWITVSVQGLHQFYTRAGLVVASWMTRQDRELAIADNLAYVRTVVARVRAEAPAGVPAVFLGFSQGAAMAFRAAAHVPGSAGVVVLAGDVPPELRAAPTRLPPVLLGRGHAEEWYTREQLAADLAWLETTGTPATLCEFEGGHEWTDAFRSAAGDFLARIASGGPR
jgi:predicted esterase